MNYELAKKLKEAGFPQRDPNGIKPFPNYTGYGTGFVYPLEDGQEQAYAPTLSELIEAVRGDKMHTFELTFNQEWAVYEPVNEDGPWAARYYDLTPVGFYERGAKTPEIAVAKLWLTLASLKQTV